MKLRVGRFEEDYVRSENVCAYVYSMRARNVDSYRYTALITKRRSNGSDVENVFNIYGAIRLKRDSGKRNDRVYLRK